MKINNQNFIVMKKSILIGFIFCGLFANVAFATDSTAKEKITPSEERVLFFTDTMPQFPGGQEALYKFIAQNLRYPFYAAKNGIQGRVMLRFIVQKDGSITNIKVISSPDESLSNEAVRVIMAMPNWIPGKLNGEPVDVYFTLPINYILQTTEEKKKK
ncbi:hypothetical protein FACS189434_01740 [Bacteroidia bacterium]|nr:hypothetical protein FACS189434_01740 [Bacteroidia bacterium]